MVKKKYFKRFEINVDIYKTGFYVLFSNDKKKVAQEINRMHKRDDITEEDFLCDGKTFYQEEVYSIIWLPAIPKSPREIANAIHELLHICFNITKRIDVNLTNSSEELFTYLMEYITREFFNHIKF